MSPRSSQWGRNLGYAPANWEYYSDCESPERWGGAFADRALWALQAEFMTAIEVSLFVKPIGMQIPQKLSGFSLMSLEFRNDQLSKNEYNYWGLARFQGYVNWNLPAVHWVRRATEVFLYWAGFSIPITFQSPSNLSWSFPTIYGVIEGDTGAWGLSVRQLGNYFLPWDPSAFLENHFSQLPTGQTAQISISVRPYHRLSGPVVQLISQVVPR
jgi:hypothetical protein